MAEREGSSCTSGAVGAREEEGEGRPIAGTIYAYDIDRNRVNQLLGSLSRAGITTDTLVEAIDDDHALIRAMDASVGVGDGAGAGAGGSGGGSDGGVDAGDDDGAGANADADGADGNAGASTGDGAGASGGSGGAPWIDVCLADVPCSSSGALRRRPGQRHVISEQEALVDLPKVRGRWCVVGGAWCVVGGAWCVVGGA